MASLSIKPLKSVRTFQLFGLMIVAGLAAVTGIYLTRHSRAATCNLPGDANCDGAVNLTDLSILAANYGQTGRIWSQGDFNNDGAVNLTDLSILAANYGSSATTQLPNPGTWTNVTSNLAGMSSQCGNLTMLSPELNTARVIAGIALDGLWATDNSGTSWTQLGQGAGSDVITNRPSRIVYDPTTAGTYWESGIYNSFGVYKTTDNGSTFHHLGTFGHIDYVSVDFTDPNRQTLLAGGHETSQAVYKSSDGGQTWTNIWSNIPSSIGAAFTNFPIVINSQTFIVNANASWAGGTPGIWRSTNSGSTWTEVSTFGPDVQPLIARDGTIYWPASGGLLKSTNQGVSWTLVGSNLEDLRPTELPDGRLVSASGANLVVSADGGNTWTPFGAALPFTLANSSDMIYSPGNSAFFISHWDCGNNVLPDAIERLK